MRVEFRARIDLIPGEYVSKGSRMTVETVKDPLDAQSRFESWIRLLEDRYPHDFITPIGWREIKDGDMLTGTYES